MKCAACRPCHCGWLACAHSTNTHWVPITAASQRAPCCGRERSDIATWVFAPRHPKLQCKLEGPAFIA
eukprot:4047191-Alexandrium_andersonii.AAC.1